VAGAARRAAMNAARWSLHREEMGGSSAWPLAASAFGDAVPTVEPGRAA
jgi:hypothetical protein